MVLPRRIKDLQQYIPLQIHQLFSQKVASRLHQRLRRGGLIVQGIRGDRRLEPLSGPRRQRLGIGQGIHFVFDGPAQLGLVPALAHLQQRRIKFLGRHRADLFSRQRRFILPPCPLGQRLERIHIRPLRPEHHIHRKFRRILHLPPPIQRRGLLGDLLANLLGGAVFQFRRVQLNIKLALRPHRQHPRRIILAEKLGNLSGILLVHLFARRLDQRRLNLLGAHLTQFRPRQIRLKRAHRPLAQRLNVPGLRIVIILKIFPQRHRNIVGDILLGLLSNRLFDPFGIGPAKPFRLDVHAELRLGPLTQTPQRIILRNIFLASIGNHITDHILDGLLESLALDDLAPPRIEDLALVIHHLVVFQQALSGLKVPFFDLLLRLFDPFADAPMLNRFALFPPDHRQRLDRPVRRKDPHQVIVK